jgi:hypothetical protein
MRGCRLYPTEDGSLGVSLVEPQPNSYDDLTGAFGNDLCLFPGTVDPGRFYSLHPQRPAGCAHTVSLDEKGGKPFRRIIGRHKGRPAFIQSGPVVIWRDSDRSMTQDPGEQAHSEVGNGIDFHSMGTIQNNLGLWSAGCWGTKKQHWAEFWQRTAGAHPQAFYLNWQFEFQKLGIWFDRVRNG